jgi:hypothetical protein
MGSTQRSLLFNLAAGEKSTVAVIASDDTVKRGAAAFLGCPRKQEPNRTDHSTGGGARIVGKTG